MKIREALSDDTMPLSRLEPLLNDFSRSNKSKHDAYDESMKDSPLKRAIKENENSIIQSILSPPSSLTATNNSNSVKTNSTGSDGLSLLLDYLFEDGQLTRIEYDVVDKGHGHGTNSAEKLVRILMQKGDGALKILLEWLNKIAPTSENVRKLCINFLPERQGERTGVIFDDEIETAGNVTLAEIASKSYGKQESEINTRVCFQLKFSLAAYNSTTKRHDFYYGRKQVNVPGGERRYDLDDPNGVSKASFNENKWKIHQEKQTAKTKVSLDPTDLRDFYLTNGCLETIRNLILNHCAQALSVLSWEKVLSNMNSLLSTDVLFIKDLLYQIKMQDHKRTQEEETRVAKMVRKIHRERRQLHHTNYLEIQQRAENGEFDSSSESEDQKEDELRYGSNQESTNNNDVQLGIQNTHGSSVNWKQVVYYSLQIWKQRNGSNSTFYSLIGSFQHSSLYQTSDFLLDYKKEIQSRENQKDADEEVFVNTGTKPKPLLQLL